MMNYAELKLFMQTKNYYAKHTRNNTRM